MGVDCTFYVFTVDSVDTMPEDVKEQLMPALDNWNKVNIFGKECYCFIDYGNDGFLDSVLSYNEHDDEGNITEKGTWDKFSDWMDELPEDKGFWWSW